MQNEDVLDEEMIDEKASGWQDKVEDKIMIEGVLKGLTEEQRSVTLLYYAEEYSVKDIAEILGIREFAARRCMEQGRNFKLSELLKGIKSCYKCDMDIKTGKISDTLGVELVILGLNKI